MFNLKRFMDENDCFGFSRYGWLSDLELRCDPAIRQYCNPSQCPSHGQNWVCPPGSGTIDECDGQLKKFNAGLLLLSITDLTPPVAEETYKTLNREHNTRFSRLAEKLAAAVDDILPLTTGGCIFCETCAYPQACVHPKKRFHSLSANGIDVGMLCEKAGLDYGWRPDRIYYTALVLMR